jgi:8-oxo-dGTP pyrophosphatase MutT (NUDIX family)
MAGPQQYPTLYGKGAFCLYYGVDPDTKENLVLLIERGEKFKGTVYEGFGAPGGYVEIGGHTEQPKEGAVREMFEEVRLPDGKPVIDKIDPHRLRNAETIPTVENGDGIDYRNGKTIHWTAYHCELKPDELKALRTHMNKMQSDPDYAAAVREASEQETKGIVLMPAAELARQIRAGAIKFAYPHEQAVALGVANGLAAAQPQARPGLKTKMNRV